MKYVGTLIVVSDIKRSIKFYTELFNQKIVADFGWNISFESGLSLQVYFDKIAGFPKEKIIFNPHNAELYFETEDFDEFTKKLEKYPDIKYMHPTKEYDWGQRVIRIFDPDYHIIEVGESIEFVIKRFFEQGFSEEEVCKKSQMPPEMVHRVKASME